MKLISLPLTLLVGLAAASHQDPVLQGTEATDDGLIVYYTLDIDTFPDAEAPDKTYILLNNVILDVKGQTDTQATIPKKNPRPIRWLQL